MQIILDSTSVDVKSKEKVINNIRLTSDCNNSKDKIVLNQDLKNHDDEEFIKLRIAKGVINTKTFKITYLKEYVNNKFSKLKDIKLFNKPSNENRFRLVLLVVIILFNLEINSEKLILQLNKFSPTSRMASDISELIFINCSIKK